MRLYVLDEKYEYENNSAGVLQLFATIQEHIEQRQYLLYSMQVNDEIIYSDYEPYVEQHLDNIQTIAAELITIEQWGHRTIMELKRYLKQSLTAIVPVVDAFYNGGSEQTRKSFSQFIEGLEWIVTATNALHSAELEQEVVGNVVQHVQKVAPFLNDIVKTMENNDYIHLADLLHYELLPLLQTMSDELSLMGESGE